MITADLVRFGILALLTLGIIADRLTIAWLLFAIFMLGSAQSFFDSAAQGMIPSIVGRDSKALVNANANLWSIDALGRGIAGPAAGSAAFSISSFTPFLFDAFSFVASAFLISRLPAPIRRVVQVPERIYIAIREGIKFVARTEPLRQGALWLGTYNFGYNVAAATLVLYAQQTLGLSAFAYGLLIATSAFGAVLGTRLATVFKGASIYMTAVITLSVQAIGWLTIVLVPSVWSTFIAYPLISIGSLFGTIIITSARHLHTPDALLGRVVSVFQFLSLSSAGLGALLGGWIADIGGLEAPFLSATATLAMFILLALLIRWGRRGISDAQS
jgi:hypothetical protein